MRLRAARVGENTEGVGSVAESGGGGWLVASVGVPEVLLVVRRHEVGGRVGLQVARQPRAARVVRRRRGPHAAHATHASHAAYATHSASVVVVRRYVERWR